MNINKKDTWINKQIKFLGQLCNGKIPYYTLFLFILLTVSFFSPLLSQESDPNTENQNNVDQEDDDEELKKLLEYIVILEKYGPKTMEKFFIQRDFEEKLFKGINDSIAIISNHMESSLITIEYYHDRVSNEMNWRNVDFYRLSFGFEYDLSKEIYKINKVRYNYYFEKNLKFLYQVEEIIEDYMELLVLAFGEDKIYPVFFQTKYFLANIHMIKNTTANVREALRRYEYVLGDNPYKIEFIPNNEYRNKLYLVIIDAYDRLLIDSYLYNTDYIKMKALSLEKLSYLWKIVDINHDDQAIKDVKYRRLYTVYSPIMNPFAEDYINTYSKYRRDGDVFPLLLPEKEDETSSQDDAIGEDVIAPLEDDLISPTEDTNVDDQNNGQ